MSQKLLPHIMLGLILLGLCIPNHLYAAEPGSDGDVVYIVVLPDVESSGEPRSPNTTTIEAWYSWNTSSVRASLANAGDSVQVEFNNLSTGEYYSFVINGNGSSVMPISDSSGYWTVSFTLSSGVIYDGYFIL